MKTIWSEERIDYDGSQLRAHWLLDAFGLVGDAAVAFRGGCRVSEAEMADLADVDGPGIGADEMLHFVWETFSTPDLLLATHRQRLLAAQVREALAVAAPGVEVRRDGDDLYVGGGKLSISIATLSPVSALVHFAVNIAPTGAPVPIACLEQLGVDPEPFAADVLERLSREQRSIADARAKVRCKGEWR